jgi:hypothetical protein
MLSLLATAHDQFLVMPKLQRVHTSTAVMGAGCSAARLDFEAAALKL